MEVCNICHKPIEEDQQWETIFMFGKAHISCVNYYWKLMRTFSIPAVILFVIGMILIALGAVGVAPEIGFMPLPAGIVLLVLGAACFISGIALFITCWVKLFSLRKNKTSKKENK